MTVYYIISDNFVRFSYDLVTHKKATVNAAAIFLGNFTLTEQDLRQIEADFPIPPTVITVTEARTFVEGTVVRRLNKCEANNLDLAFPPSILVVARIDDTTDPYTYDLFERKPWEHDGAFIIGSYHVTPQDLEQVRLTFRLPSLAFGMATLEQALADRLRLALAVVERSYIKTKPPEAPIDMLYTYPIHKTLTYPKILTNADWPRGKLLNAKTIRSGFSRRKKDLSFSVGLREELLPEPKRNLNLPLERLAIHSIMSTEMFTGGSSIRPVIAWYLTSWQQEMSVVQDILLALHKDKLIQSEFLEKRFNRLVKLVCLADRTPYPGEQATALYQAHRVITGIKDHLLQGEMTNDLKKQAC